MKECFIICPLGQEKSNTRERADKVLRHVFTPSLNSIGYTPVRADKIPKSGMITSQIINKIMDSPLVIADLTEGNPNVFYELAIRHATGKPYIQIISKGEKIPFDISGVRTLQVDIKDPDSIEDIKREIIDTIRAIENGHIPDSPISIAANVKLLQNNTKVAEDMLDKLESISGWGLTSIDDLDSKLDDILSQLDDIESRFDQI